MNKYVAWYIFGTGALACVSLYEIRKAYKKGLDNGKRIGRFNGISEAFGAIHDEWKVLEKTGNDDPLDWLVAVVEVLETFTEDITEKKEKKEDKVKPYDEAMKEFMKAAAEAQERLMTS